MGEVVDGREGWVKRGRRRLLKAGVTARDTTTKGAEILDGERTDKEGSRYGIERKGVEKRKITEGVCSELGVRRY